MAKTKIEYGDVVNVPDPILGEDWKNGFQGSVMELIGNPVTLVSVKDLDGICWDVNIERIVPLELPDDCKEIEVDDFVLVPDPNDDDMWNHSFVGHVTRIRPQIVDGIGKTLEEISDLATVLDQDGDSFDIEIDRLTLSNED